jgi:hypothetical protein
MGRGVANVDGLIDNGAVALKLMPLLPLLLSCTGEGRTCCSISGAVQFNGDWMDAVIGGDEGVGVDSGIGVAMTGAIGY